MNKKGMTIVEIIVSVSLVSIVLVFLFNIIITVNNSNAKMKNKSNLLINKGIIIKEVENDFLSLGLNGIKYCTSTELTETDLKKRIIPSGTETNSNFYCLKLEYKLAPNEPGYLIYYKQSVDNIIGYIRGTKRILRHTTQIPTGEDGIVKKWCYNTRAKYSCFVNINMPVIGDNGENYSIDLSYYYYNNLDFTFPETAGPQYGFIYNDKNSS